MATNFGPEQASNKTPQIEITGTSQLSYILNKARKLVTEDRHDDHGYFEGNFERIADLWSTYLNQEISTEQVAICMILVKVSRTKSDKVNKDNYIDIAGYAALASALRNKQERAS